MAGRLASVFDFPNLAKKSLLAGGLMLAGDVMAQTIETTFNRNSEATLAQVASLDRLKEVDWDTTRLRRMFLWGFVGAGPSMFFWYRFLDRAFPAKTMGTVLKKVALDQSLFAPCIVLEFFVFNDYMRGLSNEQIKEQLQKNYLSAMKMNYTVWPMFAALSFRFVPPHHRVFYSSFVSMGWNTYLSYVGNKQPVGAKKGQTQP
ncbi:Protein required for ethanol metabolism [Balamuthia mandrillaris]